MQFRSYSDLARTLNLGLWKIPPDVDVIVSVPRSGTIPATMLALSLNMPTTDVEGLLQGRLNMIGETRRFRPVTTRLSECSHALILDDSVLSGKTLQKVKERISEAAPPLKVTYAAVYVTPEASKLVDLYFELCPTPRVFEWNCLHHATLGMACIDLEGVLSPDRRKDPAGADDSWLPLFRPTHRLHHIVSRRSEAFRREAEDWLQMHGIAYDRLSMAGLGQAGTRSAGALKGRVLRRDARARMFISGTPSEAPAIAAHGGKPVICVGNARLYPPPTLSPARLQLRSRRLIDVASERCRQLLFPWLRGWSSPAPARFD